MHVYMYKNLLYSAEQRQLDNLSAKNKVKGCAEGK
jgi:hypothetical protein